MTVKGVDISSVQGNVDFEWLKNQGIQFVIVKCYEGNKGKDPMYERNVLGAKAAGLKVAAYHFIYPLPTDSIHPGRSPKEQAALHANAAGNIPFACCDMEWPNPQDFPKWGVDTNFVKKWVLEYLAEYERLTHKRMILYTYLFYGKFLNLSTDFAKYQLWIANFDFPPKLPYPWTDYVIQQTGGGNTGVKMTLPNGIIVDTDLAKDLSLWGVSTPEIPPPPEVPTEPLPPPIIDTSSPLQNFNLLAVAIRFFQNLFPSIFKR